MSAPSRPTDSSVDARMRRKRLTLRLAALSFVVIGLICGALSLPNGIAELQRAQTQSLWIPIEGEVIDYDSRPESLPLQPAPIRVNRPVIEYQVSGDIRSYTHPRTTELDLPLGTRVLLRYDPADPGRVTYDRGQMTWLGPLLLGTLPLVFGLALGGVMWQRSGDEIFLRDATSDDET